MGKRFIEESNNDLKEATFSNIVTRYRHSLDVVSAKIEKDINDLMLNLQMQTRRPSLVGI